MLDLMNDTDSLIIWVFIKMNLVNLMVKFWIKAQRLRWCIKQEIKHSTIKSNYFPICKIWMFSTAYFLWMHPIILIKGTSLTVSFSSQVNIFHTFGCTSTNFSTSFFLFVSIVTRCWNSSLGLGARHTECTKIVTPVKKIRWRQAWIPFRVAPKIQGDQ